MAFNRFTVLSVLATCLLAAAPLSAQQIEVYGGDHVDVPNAFDQASVYNGTYFQNVSIGEEKEYTLYVTNLDPNNPLTITSVVEGGANPDEFFFFFPYDNLEEGSWYPLSIRFKPTSAGPRSATITINSNNPGPNGTYTFSIGGVGVDGPVQETLDLQVTGHHLGAKSTTNKNGETKVRWKLKLYNLGTQPTEGGLVAFYHSEDPILSFTHDTFIGERLIKDLPPFDDLAKKAKRRKVKFKHTFDAPDGYIFAVASGYPVTPIEHELTNNVLRSGF